MRNLRIIYFFKGWLVSSKRSLSSCNIQVLATAVLIEIQPDESIPAIGTGEKIYIN